MTELLITVSENKQLVLPAAMVQADVAAIVEQPDSFSLLFDLGGEILNVFMIFSFQNIQPDLRTIPQFNFRDVPSTFAIFLPSFKILSPDLKQEGIGKKESTQYSPVFVLSLLKNYLNS